MNDVHKRCDELYTGKTGVPAPFKIEFAKKVINPKIKEDAIHKLLHERRFNQKREFFKADLNKIKNIFDAIDGEYLNLEELNNNNQPVDNDDDDDDDTDDADDADDDDDDDDYDENDNDNDDKSDENKKTKRQSYDRTLSLYFEDGQKIRHILEHHKWIGHYVKDKNMICYKKVYYKTLTSFTKAHYTALKLKVPSINGWDVCKYLKDGEWIKLPNYK
jgi:hypothetical protein